MISYQELINQSIGNVYQAGIATKILQHMGRIRNSNDQNQARRWVMELLQNARDVAWEDSMVKVRIELTDRELKFSHTGRPFRVKDILSIVNQVSSKVDDENTVGQFGTGFVTTFQLSELVSLQGVLKENGLPYKAFRVDIDRQGNTQDEVLSGIAHAMESLKAADAEPELTDYRKDEFHTTFTYVLKDENSRRIAHIGMEDLKETICYVLLFSQKIGSVELRYATSEEEKTICFVQGEHRRLGEKLQVAEFLYIRDGAEPQKVNICYATKDGMTIAANYAEESFLPLSEGCARIFVDFPLIGAEKFCFPVVINDLRLQPNEPRSGISLVDNVNSIDAQTNKEIMKRAVSCYKEFLSEASVLSLKGLNYIMEIPFFEPSKEISESWVKSYIYKEIYQYCASLPIYKTLEGMRSLNSADMYLLKAESMEKLENLKKLLKPVTGMYYPVDSVDWYRTFEAYEPPAEKMISLEKVLDKAEVYIREEGKIDEKQISTVKWCEKICDLALEDETLSRKIRAGEIAVFPSQKLKNGKVWYLKRLHEIRRDPGILEILKDITELLDELPAYYENADTKSCNLREKLLHKEFSPAKLPEMMAYEWSRLGNYIETKSNENFQILNYRMYVNAYKDKQKQIWILMAACGPDKEMYELYKQCSITELPVYETGDMPLGAGVWRNAYHGLLRLCIAEIEKKNKLEDLTWYQSVQCPDVYAWLNLFYRKWLHYQYVTEDYGLAVYLNQENVFKTKSELEWDRIEEKELKTIALGLKERTEQCNFYSRLLHSKLDFEDPSMGECRNRDVAFLINQTVTQLLTQQNLADASLEEQEACSLLLSWIQNHTEEAGIYFPAYCSEEGLMKLLTPKAAARMQQKVRKLEQIIEMLECESEDAVLQMLQEMNARKEEEKRNRCFTFLDGDVCLDGELFAELSQNGEENHLEKVCRQIGIAGEKYVLELLKQYYLGQNMQILSETEDEIRLQSRIDMEHDTHEGENNNPRSITISYPDHGEYHQAGWDISIADSANGDEMEYIEVKTHTKMSNFRNRVKLTNEQMKLALAKKEHFHVVVAIYDFHARKGDGITVYDAFLKYVQNGKLKNEMDGYLFRVSAGQI